MTKSAWATSKYWKSRLDCNSARERENISRREATGRWMGYTGSRIMANPVNAMPSVTPLRPNSSA